MNILLNPQKAEALTKSEWIELGTWLDGGGELLNSVNKHLARIAPEVFFDPNEPTPHK